MADMILVIDANIIQYFPSARGVCVCVPVREEHHQTPAGYHT